MSAQLTSQPYSLIVKTDQLLNTSRGAPDLDPDPAGYPVFFQDPDPAAYKNIRIRQNPDPAVSKQSGSGQPDSLPCSTNQSL